MPTDREEVGVVTSHVTSCPWLFIHTGEQLPLENLLLMFNHSSLVHRSTLGSPGTRLIPGYEARATDRYKKELMLRS